MIRNQCDDSRFADHVIQRVLLYLSFFLAVLLKRSVPSRTTECVDPSGLPAAQV